MRDNATLINVGMCLALQSVVLVKVGKLYFKKHDEVKVLKQKLAERDKQLTTLHDYIRQENL